MSNGVAAVQHGWDAHESWWVPLVMGIVAIILGALFLGHPAESAVWVTFGVGFWFMLSGLTSLFALFADRTLWGWKLVSGILGLLAGFFVIDAATRTPLLAAVGLGALYVIMIGISGVMIGVADIVRAFQGGGWGIGVIGVLSVLFGFFLLFNPLAGAISLPIVLGVLAIVFGFTGVIAAFRLHATT